MSTNYDSFTGQEAPELAEARLEEVSQIAITEMNALLALEKHPGWLLVKAAMEHTIEKEKNSLLHSSEFDTIRYFQSQIKARKDLLGWLEIKILEGRRILDERARRHSDEG